MTFNEWKEQTVRQNEQMAKDLKPEYFDTERGK